MYAVGFLILVTGAYLIDSAVKGRPPIETLKQILVEPGNVSGVLARNEGSYEPTFALQDDSESAAEGADSSTDTAYTKKTPNTSSGSAGAQVSTGAATSGKAATVINYARAQLGKPYAWGGVGPKSFDCSGLTLRAYETIGIKLGRTTYQQAAQGTAVKKADLIPGDLVFPTPGHVQMYIGDGKIIEAPRTGLDVRVSVLGRVYKARRYIK